jgi:hypothetical protein
MHRPTRKLRNLKAKAERKAARSRHTGPKAKRWKQQIEKYTPLSEDASAS